MTKVLFGLLIVITVALWSVWPMVERPDRVADYGKDGMYLAALQMNWHQKISDYIRHIGDPQIALFDGYFLYAEKSSMVYSDMLLVTSLMTYWLSKFWDIPAGGAGWALVFWQMTTMVVSYALFAKVSKSIWGGMVGAVAFGVSQIHFMYQVHLHTWNMTLWLLSYWLLSYFVETRKIMYLVLSGVFLGLQMWESPLGVYFGILMIATQIILNSQFLIPIQLSFKNLLIFIFSFGAVAVWPARAYWEVSQYYYYVRTIRDAAHHGLSLNNLNGFVSPGLFLLFIFVIAKVSSYQFAVGNKFRSLKFFSFLIIGSYILALGPVLKWDDRTVKIGGKVPIPLPYAVAYYAVPGWQAFRVPSRWLVVMGWAMGGIIAATFNNTPSNPPLKFKRGTLGGVQKTVGIAGCIMLAILGGTRLVKYVDLPREIPREYLTDEEVLTFRPMGSEAVEIERMYFSIMAGKKTMNGYSGFVPPERVKYLMK